MIDGIVTPALRDIDYLAPSAPYPATPSGLTVHQNPIYRYSVPTDEQPVLAIENYIPDYNGNFIKPGFYQLALSNDREFLYLIESKELIAVIPVFKLAENEKELKKYYEKNKEEVIEILKNGTKKANKKANETLMEVKSAIGIDYFKYTVICKFIYNRFILLIKECVRKSV